MERPRGEAIGFQSFRTRVPTLSLPLSEGEGYETAILDTRYPDKI